MKGVIDFESLRTYDLAHVLLKTRSYVSHDEPIIVCGFLKEGEREKIEKVCRDYGCNLEGPVKSGKELKKLLKGAQGVVFASGNRILINSVIEVFDYGIFLLPEKDRGMIPSIERRGYRAYAYRFARRVEGAIARVLNMDFDDVIKAREYPLRIEEESLISFCERERSEEELIREYGHINLYTLKLNLARLVLEGKLYTEQREKRVYYRKREVSGE